MRQKKQKRALNTICSRKENYIKIEAQSIRKEMVKNEKIGYVLDEQSRLVGAEEPYSDSQGRRSDRSQGKL